MEEKAFLLVLCARPQKVRNARGLIACFASVTRNVPSVVRLLCLSPRPRPSAWPYASHVHTHAPPPPCLSLSTGAGQNPRRCCNAARSRVSSFFALPYRPAAVRWGGVHRRLLGCLGAPRGGQARAAVAEGGGRGVSGRGDCIAAPCR